MWYLHSRVRSARVFGCLVSQEDEVLRFSSCAEKSPVVIKKNPSKGTERGDMGNGALPFSFPSHHPPSPSNACTLVLFFAPLLAPADATADTRVLVSSSGPRRWRSCPGRTPCSGAAVRSTPEVSVRRGGSPPFRLVDVLGGAQRWSNWTSR